LDKLEYILFLGRREVFLLHFIAYGQQPDHIFGIQVIDHTLTTTLPPAMRFHPRFSRPTRSDNYRMRFCVQAPKKILKLLAKSRIASTQKSQISVEPVCKYKAVTH
jgi:hypothetical protein